MRGKPHHYDTRSIGILYASLAPLESWKDMFAPLSTPCKWQRKSMAMQFERTNFHEERQSDVSGSFKMWTPRIGSLANCSKCWLTTSHLRSMCDQCFSFAPPCKLYRLSNCPLSHTHIFSICVNLDNAQYLCVRGSIPNKAQVETPMPLNFLNIPHSCLTNKRDLISPLCWG